MSVCNELGLVVREVFENERREVSIFSESEQVLLVKRIENTLFETARCQPGSEKGDRDMTHI